MQCENPLCNVESMYFRSGSLHCIDRCGPVGMMAHGDQRRVIWLCEDCSMHFTVETWRPPGQQLQESRLRIASVPGHRAYDMRPRHRNQAA